METSRNLPTCGVCSPGRPCVMHQNGRVEPAPDRPIDELGGLSEAERAQLAADLRRIQDEMGQLGLRHVQDPMGDLVQHPREHVTDGPPCWCGPTLVDPDNESRLPLAELPSADADVNAGTPAVDPWDADGGSGAGPWDRTRQFGGRLRGKRWLTADDCDEIADEIDHDAEQLGDKLGSALTALETEERRTVNLRESIEGAVEGLSFAIIGGYVHADGDPPPTKNVIESEKLSAELDRIFGQRLEQPPQATVAPDARWFEIPGRDGAKGLRVAVGLDGQTHLWPLDPDVNPGFALSGEAARDLEIILRAFLPGDVALAAEAVAALEVVPPEHESAAERRERASARNERSDGRVDGVDR